MSKQFESVGETFLLKAKKVKDIKDKKPRIHSWKKRMEGKQLNRFGKHFYCNVEVFVPKPKLEDRTPSVFVHASNASQDYFLQEFTLGQFLENPFGKMMDDCEKGELKYGHSIAEGLIGRIREAGL